jgi:hypothetical protein
MLKFVAVNNETPAFETSQTFFLDISPLLLIK